MGSGGAWVKGARGEGVWVRNRSDGGAVVRVGVDMGVGLGVAVGWKVGGVRVMAVLCKVELMGRMKVMVVVVVDVVVVVVKSTCALLGSIPFVWALPGDGLSLRFVVCICVCL